MKHPQLYIKNEKGRYEPYKLPEPDVSGTVYRKINGKYEPIGRFFDRDYLTEGVWVVYCDHAFCNGKYLRNKYSMEKVSSLQGLNLSQLGSIERAIEQAFRELTAYKAEKLRTTGYSEYEGYHFVARRTIELLMEKQKK